MKDTELIRLAKEIMIDAHHHRTTAYRRNELGYQVDKSGEDYIFHPLSVALFADGGTIVTCAALLHDVLEDTDYTAEELLGKGIPAEVVETVQLLSCPYENPMEEEYLSYVREIAKHPYARAVKLADLSHNMDVSRLPEEERTKDYTLARLQKYAKARAIILAAMDEAEEMKVNAYQKEAMRTLNPDLDRKDVLINSVMGLCGESGEAIDIVKKWLAQGHELNREELIKELGDIAWYLAEAAEALDVSLEDVLRGNLAKLRRRYPDGFETAKSVSREK